MLDFNFKIEKLEKVMILCKMYKDKNQAFQNLIKNEQIRRNDRSSGTYLCLLVLKVDQLHSIKQLIKKSIEKGNV